MKNQLEIAVLITNTIITLGILAFSAYLCWYFESARYAWWSLLAIVFHYSVEYKKMDETK